MWRRLGDFTDAEDIGVDLNRQVVYESTVNGVVAKIELLGYYDGDCRIKLNFDNKENYEKFTASLNDAEITFKDTIKHEYFNSIMLEEPSDLMALMALIEKIDKNIASLTDEIKATIDTYKLLPPQVKPSRPVWRMSTLHPFSLDATDLTIHDKRLLTPSEKARKDFLWADIRDGAKKLSAVMLQEEKAKARLDDPSLSPISRAKAIEDFLLLDIEKRDLARANLAKVEEEKCLLRRSTQ